MADFDFVTKEDLEAINADPKLAKAYKSMQAGFTKRMQEVGTTADQLRELQATIDEQQDLLDQWEQWRPTLTKVLEQGNNPSNTNPDEGGRRSKSRSRSSDDDTYTELQERLERTEQQLQHVLGEGQKLIKGVNDRTERMFDLQLQLGELRLAHPDVDAKKVLKTALDKGYDNLTDAYDSAYRDEIVNKAAETKAKTMYEEYVNKHKTDESGNLSQPHESTIFKLPTERAKNFTEATDSALAEHKEGKLVSAGGAPEK